MKDEILVTAGKNVKVGNENENAKNLTGPPVHQTADSTNDASGIVSTLNFFDTNSKSSHVCDVPAGKIEVSGLPVDALHTQTEKKLGMNLPFLCLVRRLKIQATRMKIPFPELSMP